MDFRAITQKLKSLSTGYQIGISLAIIGLLGLSIFVAPTLFAEPTAETEYQLTDKQLIGENNEEFLVDSDMSAFVEQQLTLQQSGSPQGAHLFRSIEYDSDTERLKIEYRNPEDDRLAESKNSTSPVAITYYERDPETGEIVQYTLDRVYDYGTDSWNSVPDASDRQGCELSETKLADRETDYVNPTLTGQDSLGTDIVTSSGSEFVQYTVTDTESTRTLQVDSGWTQSTVFSGGAIHITETSGEIQTTKIETGEETKYVIQNSDLSATGVFYNGYQGLPITNWFDSSQLALNYTVDSQETDVNLERPSWVEEYDNSC